MQASPKEQTVEAKTNFYHVLESNHQEGQEGLQFSPKEETVEAETHFYSVIECNHQERQEGLQSSHTTEVSPQPYTQLVQKQCKHTALFTIFEMKEAFCLYFPTFHALCPLLSQAQF